GSARSSWPGQAPLHSHQATSPDCYLQRFKQNEASSKHSTLNVNGFIGGATLISTVSYN
ncbi:hypothetical protein CEXT_17601, partial [Caerostris extrusa]